MIPLCNIFCVDGVEERYERHIPNDTRHKYVMEVCVVYNSFSFLICLVLGVHRSWRNDFKLLNASPSYSMVFI